MMERVVHEIRQAGMVIQKVIDNRLSPRTHPVAVRVIDINTGIILSDPTPRRKRIRITS